MLDLPTTIKPVLDALLTAVPAHASALLQLEHSLLPETWLRSALYFLKQSIYCLRHSSVSCVL